MRLEEFVVEEVEGPPEAGEEGPFKPAAGRGGGGEEEPLDAGKEDPFDTVKSMSVSSSMSTSLSSLGKVSPEEDEVILDEGGDEGRFRGDAGGDGGLLRGEAGGEGDRGNPWLTGE